MAGTPLLPCLRRNNSIRNSQTDASKPASIGPAVPVSRGAYKTEFCIKTNVELAAKFYGLGHLGFFTQTFAKRVYSAKKAQQRLNSLLSNVIRPRYGNRYIVVFHRHESGAIHFHFVVYVEKDIRSGFDWDLKRRAEEAQEEGDFVEARRLWTAATERAKNGGFLREEWKFWRGMRKRYRWLGRCEMLPIRTNAEAIAKYTSGYIAKHMQNRRPEDKGVRIVRCGKEMCRAHSRLAFNSPGPRRYRRKLAAYAAQPHVRAAGVEEYGDMKRVFGKRWGFHLHETILAMKLDTDATPEEA